MKPYYLFKILCAGITLFFIQNIAAQNTNEKIYDVYTDTLLIINNKVIVEERIYMNRQELMEADTFKINQKGLIITGFTFSAISLGNAIEINADKPVLSQAMKNEIINKNSKFKFIYIKDIILQANDGRVLQPSLNSIKIIFNN